METAREQWIRERAYALWETDGRPDGRDADYWHRAALEYEQSSAIEQAAAPVSDSAAPGRAARGTG